MSATGGKNKAAVFCLQKDGSFFAVNGLFLQELKTNLQKQLFDLIHLSKKRCFE